MTRHTDIDQAINTVEHEMPGAHLDDILDALYGLLGERTFDMNIDYISDRLGIAR